MKQSGFTLLEVLLSIAVITIIAGISVPIYQLLQVRNNLDIATVAIAQTLRRAQTLSQAVASDTSWGVAIASETITLFQGTSYATRDTAFDEVFETSINVVPSGVSEIVFTKFTGLPQTTGTITLTSNTNETRIITVNAKGMVSY